MQFKYVDLAETNRQIDLNELPKPIDLALYVLTLVRELATDETIPTQQTGKFTSKHIPDLRLTISSLRGEQVTIYKAKDVLSKAVVWKLIELDPSLIGMEGEITPYFSPYESHHDLLFTLQNKISLGFGIVALLLGVASEGSDIVFTDAVVAIPDEEYTAKLRGEIKQLVAEEKRDNVS